MRPRCPAPSRRGTGCPHPPSRPARGRCPKPSPNEPGRGPAMRSPVSAYTVYDDAGNSVKAELTKAIATGVATTVVKGGSGRLVNVVITSAGTSSDNLTIYDNASAGSGAILAVIPGGTTLT